ncbi:MAG: cyclase family protein [Gemmatimonadaceae bacterium]
MGGTHGHALRRLHWVTGKDLPHGSTDTIQPRRFVGPALRVFDASAESAKNPDFLVTREWVAAGEATHGKCRVARGCCCARIGASARVPRSSTPTHRVHTRRFHQDVSAFLAHERDVLGVGVETIGTDAGQAGSFNPPFPNHGIMHGAGKFGLASLCNLDRLPATGAVVIAAPLKLVNGSGSPLRVIALVPRS